MDNTTVCFLDRISSTLFLTTNHISMDPLTHSSYVYCVLSVVRVFNNNSAAYVIFVLEPTLYDWSPMLDTFNVTYL